MSVQPSCGDSALLVTLKDATKHYRGRIALRLAELQLRKGDSMLIIGANGSGKSTLLRVLAGVTTLSTGMHVTSRRLMRSRSAMSRKWGLHPNLTVAENLSLAVQLRGRQPPDRWRSDGMSVALAFNHFCRPVFATCRAASSVWPRSVVRLRRSLVVCLLTSRLVVSMPHTRARW